MRARVVIFFIVIILGFIIYLFSVFSNKTISSSSYKINHSNWGMLDTLIFDFENKKSHMSDYKVVVFGKINQNYSYANLYLFLDLFLENQKVKSDTLTCSLYDVFGKPTQTNIGNTQFFKLKYSDTFKFDHNKKYKFKVIHGMRDSILFGVETIGLKIIK